MPNNRNKPCPCCSGKKLKQCHGAPALREKSQHPLVLTNADCCDLRRAISNLDLPETATIVFQ